MNFQLRKHQAEFVSVMQQYIRGEGSANNVLLNVTPGGGKSTIPILGLKLLKDAGLADRCCWLAPRSSLQSQGAESFQDIGMRSALGHSLSLNESTNEVDPARGTDGYITTYQAIGRDSAGINVAEFTRARYLLVLDELHHVVEGGSWHRALIPLKEQAAFVIYMTGTLARHDQKKIAFLPYKEIAAC